MALLSRIARRRKLEYFLSFVSKTDRILEIGCADGWVGAYAMAHGWHRFVGIDVVEPPAPLPHEFVYGDIQDWQQLGLEPGSFDAVIAFEVVEHGDFFKAIGELLRPGGLLLVTTPLPHRDWICKILEAVRLNQRRTSPHDHLIYLRDFPAEFHPVRTEVKAGLSQWGVFQRLAT
jgi:2-polyprenyl-3-methyl-5-hydroxy-6-metoxy-1,4-benzoquinol methylase